MITPREIKKKAIRRYKAVCAAFLRGEEIFPLVIPGNRGKTTDPYMQRKKGLERLINGSKEKIGRGYTIEWEEINTRQYGVQSMVKGIFFHDRDDYLVFIDKKRVFDNISSVADLIRRELPQLEEWMQHNPLALETSINLWPGILQVCSWFMHNPFPWLYIRELPIPVHTKFIEEQSSLLISLLDFLLPPEQVNKRSRDFAKRYYLRWDEPLVRCRFLNTHGEDDFSRPLFLFSTRELPGCEVFIIENKINFLTFPVTKGRLVIWGKGFSAAALKEVTWLSSRDLYYWGDIDPPGFEILAAVREFFPGIKSFLMNRECYEKYKHFAVYCDTGKTDPPPGLTDEEAELYMYLKAHPEKGRLEQERIPQEEVIRELKGG